ncbi:MAG: radical SAM protein, partial [Actinomycetota bacterium]
DTVAAMAECRSVCEHIHLPVQAGSDQVLKRMKRAYSRERYLEKVQMVRDAIPDVAVTTDIIVGFPGETEEDFDQTLSLVEEARYDAAFTFQYSSRPMTEAQGMDGHLPKAVVQQRYDRLTHLQEAISSERNAGDVGATHEVIVEGASKKDPSKLTGRTRTNKLVHFASDGAREGDFRMVSITGAHAHFLEGMVVGAGNNRARMSLPLAASTSECSSCA